MHKTYRKLIPNPLGLGTVVIYQDIFSDDNIPDDIARAKLQNHLKLRNCEEYLVVEQSQTVNLEIEVLRKELDEAKATIIAKDDEIHQLKLLLVAGYNDMNVESLATDFTLDELKFIATVEGVGFPQGIKESALAKKIVEARG